jgi:hypothetical protein
MLGGANYGETGKGAGSVDGAEIPSAISATNELYAIERNLKVPSFASSSGCFECFK